MPKGLGEGKLVARVTGFDKDEGECLTAAQIGAAFKAALSDFVGGKASRPIIKEVTNLLNGALKARVQERLERAESAAPKDYFPGRD